MPSDCFADEIAIDFPSMARMVQRMRATFFAENPGGDLEYHAQVLRSDASSSRHRSRPRNGRSTFASRFNRRPTGD